jgi:predicted nucleic acid-binding protein
MNGKKALLDSNIIIYISKGFIRIDDILNEYEEIYISLITYIETLGYNFGNSEEEALIDQLLQSFNIINIDIQIADISIKYRKIRQIKIADSIVLATANYKNCDLITRNVSDFQNIDANINIINPFNK